MGIVTTSSATAFNQSAAAVYDLATNPANWPKLYPGSAHVGEVPTHLPLQVGDTWTEAGQDANLIFTWQLAIATRPNYGCSIPLAALAMTMKATAASRGVSRWIPFHPAWRRYHPVYPDDDDRGIQGRPAAGRILPQCQSDRHRPIPRSDCARACAQYPGTGLKSDDSAGNSFRAHQ